MFMAGTLIWFNHSLMPFTFQLSVGLKLGFTLTLMTFARTGPRHQIGSKVHRYIHIQYIYIYMYAYFLIYIYILFICGCACACIVIVNIYIYIYLRLHSKCPFLQEESKPSQPVLEPMKPDMDVKRSGSTESLNQPEFKRRKTVDSQTTAFADLNFEHVGIEDLEDQDRLEVQSLLEDDQSLAMYLDEAEIAGLMGDANCLLKTYRTREPSPKVIVLSRGTGKGSDLVRGYLDVKEIRECPSFSTGIPRDINFGGMYVKSHIKKLASGPGTAYLWKIGRTTLFDESLPVPPATKYRNCAFKLSSATSRDVVDGPQKQCLVDMAEYFFGRLSERLQSNILQSALICSGGVIRVGTTCSGSDICVTVLRKCVEFLNNKCGNHVKVAHIFSCEANRRKRELILQQHADVEHIFENVSVFSKGRGFCFKCNKEHTTRKPLLAIDFFYCGPSCKDVSSLNQSRQEFANCYQDARSSHGTDENEDPENQEVSGTSGPTYKDGYKAVS